MAGTSPPCSAPAIDLHDGDGQVGQPDQQVGQVVQPNEPRGVLPGAIWSARHETIGIEELAKEVEHCRPLGGPARRTGTCHRRERAGGMNYLSSSCVEYHV